MDFLEPDEHRWLREAVGNLAARYGHRYYLEQSRGGGPERAEGLAAEESLKVSQAQGARFAVVPGEVLGVLHEFLVGHAELADVVFEQCPWWPVGQFHSPPGWGGSVAV